jgi:glyoxylase-like metal-dependent hydrolase (beta-lactamase superfamily II)
MALTEEAYEKISSHIAMLHNATNIGIAEDGDRLFLVDTGSDDDAGKHILRILEKVYAGKKLDACINTHSHADHCGGNDYLVRHTDCEIWAPEKETKSIEFPSLQSTIVWGGRPFRDIETKFFQAQRGTHVSKVIDGMFYGNSNGAPVNGSKNSLSADGGSNRANSDGSKNDSSANSRTTGKGNAVSADRDNSGTHITMTAVPLPGHYFDQTGVLLHDNDDGKNVFFLGDALFGKSIIKKYWIPFLYDVGQFRTSLETIENTDADFFIPSHGEIYTKENIHEIAELNKLTTLETEALVLKILKAPHTAEELLTAVADFGEIPLAMGQYVLIGCTLRSYLSCLYNENKVKYELVNNRMLWETV